MLLDKQQFLSSTLQRFFDRLIRLAANPSGM